MRRVLLATSLALALAAPARADVFVPDDPAQRNADCRAQAADVATETRRYPEVSEGGGPWRRLRGMERCPWLTAAVDGTAVLVSDSRASVRPAGGRFGEPFDVGGSTADVAAAPGGWVALAREDGTLTTIAPDGSRRVEVVSREVSEGPRVGIGSGGGVVTAWTTFTSTRYALHVRGGPFGAGRTFPAGEPPASGARSAAPFALAVSPGGRALLAWTDDEGVQVTDGGEPQRLTAERETTSLTVSIADDGGRRRLRRPARARLDGRPRRGRRLVAAASGAGAAGHPGADRR